MVTGGPMIEHLKGREQELASLGWTGREAEWIALVCLHSGVFTRAQFCHYFEAHGATRPTGLCGHWWNAGRLLKASGM